MRMPKWVCVCAIRYSSTGSIPMYPCLQGPDGRRLEGQPGASDAPPLIPTTTYQLQIERLRLSPHLQSSPLHISLAAARVVQRIRCAATISTRPLATRSSPPTPPRCLLAIPAACARPRIHPCRDVFIPGLAAPLRRRPRSPSRHRPEIPSVPPLQPAVMLAW